MKGKISISIHGHMRLFIEDLAKRYFEGSTSSAVRFCVWYVKEQTEKYKADDWDYLTALWFDLPKLKADTTAINLVGEDTFYNKRFYVLIEPSLIEFLDSYAKEKTTRVNKAAKVIECYKYPHFRGLRRNVIYQCILTTMFDITQVALYGYTLENVDDLFKFRDEVYNKETKELGV